MSLVTDISDAIIAASTIGTFFRLGVVHKAVNSTAAKQNSRVDELTQTLTHAGVDVPPRTNGEADDISP